MTTLRAVIEEKVAGLRGLVEQSRKVVRGEESRQETIFRAITVEQGRLASLGAYLDEEVADARAELLATLEAYSVDLPKAP